VNIDEVEKLADLLERHGLEELEWSRSDQHIRLVRGGKLHAVPMATSHAINENLPISPNDASQKDSADEKLFTITSPMIGTFYRSPAPDRPAFVEIGSSIRKNTTVCILEAMKVLNEIPAEVEGTIVDVMVSDGHAVEFGQPLFKVRLPS
jgi:acetyl-CoA carboxylase biotin carboxyl carrier protein